MKPILHALILASLFCVSAPAAIIKAWDFNSPDVDGLPDTGTLRPVNGTGYPGETGGGVGGRFGTAAGGGSTDPNTLDNSQWRLGTNLGGDGFPAASNANKTAGAQFRVNTSGYGNIQVTWDQENSATASRYWRVQYTTNGLDWQDHSLVVTALDSGDQVSTPPWQLSLLADFSATPGVNNNPDFGFRLVSEFESTATGAGAAAYVANRLTSAYSTAGTLWLDMITVNGDDLNPANQPPQISSLTNHTTLVGTATPALPFTISDAETPAGDLIATAHSSNPTLVSSFTFGGAGSDRTLTVTPAAGQTGTAIVTVRVTDQGGKVAESSFQLTVVVPVLSRIPAQMTTWDAPLSLPFTVFHLPGDPATWTLTGTSSDPSMIANADIGFTGSGNTRNVMLAPKTNAIGDTIITVTVGTVGWQATTNFLVRLLPDYVVEYDLSALPNSAVPSAPATRVDPGLAAAPLTRGPGIAAAALTSGFSANRWNNPASAHSPSSPSRANALSRGDYFEFAVTVNAGATLSLATLDASMRRSALNAALNFEWQYSYDGFATAGTTILPAGPIWDQLGWTESFFTFRGRTSGTLPAQVTPYSWMVQDSPGQPNLTTSPGYPIPTIDLSGISELQAINGPKTVTFRLYGWGNDSTADSNTTALGRVDGPRLRGSFAAVLAELTLPSGDLIYGIGQPAIGIDGRATIQDATPGYAGATLTVALTNHATADDRLEIRHTGSGAGQVGISGNSVSFGGTAVATFAGGGGVTPLVVTFTSAATPAAAEAVLRQVTFRNVSSTPARERRAIAVTLQRADGFTTTKASGIRVSELRYADFQEGADRGFGVYAGQSDTELFESQPGTPFPTGHSGTTESPRLWMDARTAGTQEEAQALLRFDHIVGNGPGQVPPGAIVVSAELILNVVDPGDGSPLYRMLVPWDAATATWDSFGAGIQPDGTEARVTSDSQIGVALAGGDTGFGQLVVGVTADVQAWVNGETNHGWGMTSWDQDLDPAWGRGTDGLAFNPSETPSVNDRPRLRVLWLPAGTASASFRQGVNDYAGTRDTRIRANEPDVEASTFASVFVDWDVASNGTRNEDQVLIRFDEILGTASGQIPMGAVIEAAVLDLAIVVNNAYGEGGQFHGVLTPWQDTNTWNSLGNGIQNDGVEAASIPTVVAGSPSLNPNVAGGFMAFDITADVQAWANGSRANHGWVIFPWPDGSDGWGISTSEAIEERERPRLRVFYSAGSTPVVPITMRSPVLSPTNVTVGFSGSPNQAHHVLRAPTVLGPWTTNGTVSPDGLGNAVHTDNAPISGGAFYRVFRP